LPNWIIPIHTQHVWQKCDRNYNQWHVAEIISKLFILTFSENTQSEVCEPSKAAECFNGAKLKNYMWSQTGSDVDVRVPVAGNIKGKDIHVEIKDKYLKVALKHTPGR
jgi:hypothetical protein